MLCSNFGHVLEQKSSDFAVSKIGRRNRLIGKSAVLKTAAVRLGGSSPSSSVKSSLRGSFFNSELGSRN